MHRRRSKPLIWILALIFVLTCLLLQSIRLRGDGLSYYAYDRSLLFDHDLDFANEFQAYNPAHDATPDLTRRTDTGLVSNPYTVGPALLWSPFILVVHMVYRATRLGVDLCAAPAATGYEFPYVAAITLGTNFYALLGLLALCSVSAHYFGSRPAFMAVLGIWFGTSYLHYLYFEPAYAHVLGASLVALFIWSYNLYHAHRHWSLLLRTGVIAGLMILTRWQNAVFLIIPVVDAVMSLMKISSRSRKQITCAVIQSWIFISIVVLLFMPQALVWKQLYGRWLTVPMGTTSMRWFAPALLEVLFSARNGLFAWTPLVAISVVGLAFLYRQDQPLAIALLIALLAQWWVNASVADWWGGSAFGGRRFIDSSVIFVVGLAGVLHQMAQWRGGRTIGLLALSLTIAWNVALWTQYAVGTPPVQSMHDLGQIYWGQFTDGFPQVYRLLGRSTWLDLAVRSGILQQQWTNVRTALVWMVVLIAMVYLVVRGASIMGMSNTAP